MAERACEQELPLSPELGDPFEIVEDRYRYRSTILASQMPMQRWHHPVGDPTVANPSCDQLPHNAHRIELHGPSRRPEKKKQE